MLFVINEVFNISGIGIVITAEIQNNISVGEKIIIASSVLTATGHIKSIEKFVDNMPTKIESAFIGELSVFILLVLMVLK